jgi:lipopolysaccharide transport system permease protein
MTDATAPTAARRTSRNYVVDITPTKGWRPIDFGELWAYRELLGILVWRDVKVRYRQTFLGVAWVVAQPLMTMLVFTVLFNRVARIQTGSDVPYALFVLSGVIPWTLFSSGVTNSGNSLIGASHLISKVYFPRMIIPAAGVAGGIVDLLVTLFLLAAMMVWYGVPPGPLLVLVPIPILLTIILAFGAGLWLSALNVEYRDMRVIAPFIVQFWMYATPVVYPLALLSPKLRIVANLNPMTPVVELFRVSLLGGTVPVGLILYSALFALLLLVSGSLYFRRVERTFADRL